MAELTPKERLQPSLLDRLTDEEPDKAQESREQRVLSMNRLRLGVLRDLAWLFNATRMPESSAIERYPFAAHSVINFGLPPLSGVTARSLDVNALEQTLRQVIIDFEPRILRESLEVHAVATESVLDTHNIIEFQIRAQLWSQPVPLEILLRQQLDLEAGQVEVRDMLAGLPRRVA